MIMKKVVLILSLLYGFFVFSQEQVAVFKGIQVTGIAVSDKGRIFANFPRWREPIPFSVVEVFQDGTYAPYPNTAWNVLKTNQGKENNTFVAIQSVVAEGQSLYVLETSNPQFKGVQDHPKLYVFDLNSNQLKHTYLFSKESYHKNSYINDLRIDIKRQLVYCTDSGVGGIVVLDLKTGTSKRYLDQHKVTMAEKDQLNCSNGIWKNTVHSDGIEFDAKNDMLYFHALTAYTLYGIKIDQLIKNDASEIIAIPTAAPDGLIMDKKGNLYYGDLEHDAIHYLDRKGKINVLTADKMKVKWADSFAIHKDYLYYTNSRINEATGDIKELDFTIYKMKLKE
jgi:sugar lactone lactonase YvrE